MTHIELKTCPFCGGEAVLRYAQQAFNDYEVWCLKCGMCGPNFGSMDETMTPMQDAIDHWNTRA